MPQLQHGLKINLLICIFSYNTDILQHFQINFAGCTFNPDYAIVAYYTIQQPAKHGTSQQTVLILMNSNLKMTKMP